MFHKKYQKTKCNNEKRKIFSCSAAFKIRPIQALSQQALFCNKLAS
jgi:hypothetical protein